MNKVVKDLKWAQDNDLTVYHDSDLYDDMLDECYGLINICGHNYSPSRALKEVDEVAYRCGMNDYIDSIKGETVVELDDETLVDLNEYETLISSLEE